MKKNNWTFYFPLWFWVEFLCGLKNNEFENNLENQLKSSFFLNYFSLFFNSELINLEFIFWVILINHFFFFLNKTKSFNYTQIYLALIFLKVRSGYGNISLFWDYPLHFCFNVEII